MSAVEKRSMVAAIEHFCRTQRNGATAMLRCGANRIYRERLESRASAFAEVLLFISTLKAERTRSRIARVRAVALVVALLLTGCAAESGCTSLAVDPKRYAGVQQCPPPDLVMVGADAQSITCARISIRCANPGGTQ